MIVEVLARFGDRVNVRVVNAFSPEGLWLALRRGARQYPTWLVGRQKIVGYNMPEVIAAVQAALGSTRPPEHPAPASSSTK